MSIKAIALQIIVGTLPLTIPVTVGFAGYYAEQWDRARTARKRSAMIGRRAVA